MNGPSAVHHLPPRHETAEVVMLTPSMAKALLARNKSNRRYRAYHAGRIARLIKGGRFRFNGDTIKIDRDGNLQDGQHRCGAVVEANIPVKVVIVYGVERDAFPTIDTMRLSRSYGDIIDLRNPDGSEAQKYGAQIGGALAWLARFDQDVIPQMNQPENRIENDIIDMYAQEHPGLADWVVRLQRMRTVLSPAILGFFLYVLARASRTDLAERIIRTFERPDTVGPNDPYQRLYQWLVNNKKTAARRSGIMVVALLIKATNAAARGQELGALSWRPEPTRRCKAETFPTLDLPQ